MTRNWNPIQQIGFALRNLRSAKRLLSDERLPSIEFDTRVISTLQDELYELGDLVDELEQNSADRHTRFIEECAHGR